MKYLKTTIAIFVVAICLSMTGINASTYFVIQGIKVPILSNSWMSKEAQKGDDGQEQKIKKVSCTDDISGDGRVLLGQVMIMLDALGTTNTLKLPQGKNISFGSSTIAMAINNSNSKYKLGYWFTI